MLKKAFKSLAAAAVVCASFASFASEGVFEDDFKSYPDFDPGIRNWQFRGVCGEIIGGSFQFTGVTEKQSEYWDIGPDYAMGLVRDFLAGPKLKVEAKIKCGPHKFPAFDPGKGANSRMGIVVLSQSFARKRATPMDVPALELTLNKSASGARSVSFDYAGKDKPKIDAKSIVDLPDGDWKDGVEYFFEISFDGTTATGSVMEGSKTVFKRELKSPTFQRVFEQAYPGFANLRMTGQMSFFRASNLGSFQSSEGAFALQVPSQWTLFSDVKDPAKLPVFDNIPESIGDSRGSSVSIEAGKPFDLGKLLGGYKPGKAAALLAKVSAKSPGLYAVNFSADWFWRLDVNGKTVVDLLKDGNGAGAVRTVLLRLKGGENLIGVVVGSGSKGWNLRFDAATQAQLASALAKEHLYGSDALIWNIERLLDDVAKLKRDGIEIAGLEGSLLDLRGKVPGTLSSRGAAAYDQALDAAYAKVYDGYRARSLAASIEEAKALAAALGSSENDARIAKLSSLLERLKASACAGAKAQAERDASEAQRLLDECAKASQGFAEGVTKGGSFGRFGWITSDSVGAYTSGDGLLANQVLSSGALVRQYVFAERNELSSSGKESCWSLRFAFDGERDAAKEAELASLKTLSANVDVKFGYDPTKFYSGSTPESVKVKAIDWSRKKFSFSDKFVADMSLLSPSLLLESPCRRLSLSDPATGAFSRIGYIDSEGKTVSLPASANGVLYDRDRDGRLGSNWILLWSDANSASDLAGHAGCVPLQAIFQRQPDKIERVGSSVVVSLGVNGAVWLNTPFGSRVQPAGNWFGLMPPSALASCELFGRSALAYPQGCREFYRLDEASGRVEILDAFSYRLFKDNDWGIEPLELAPIPPLLSLMADKGFDAALPSGLFDLSYPTVYGPLRAVKGTQVRYSLPVPFAPRLLLPRNLEAPQADVDLLKRTAMNLIEGARFRLYDEKTCRSWHSVNFPFLAAAKPWPYLDQAAQDYLRGLLAANMTMSSGYRSNRVWRSLVEPYSGRKYFYSFSIGAEEPGDVAVFGDRGYGVGNHLNQLDYAAALSGDYETLRKLFKDASPLASPEASRDGRVLTIDKMLGYVKGVHDWAWMDDGSNDSGDNGPVVDCSQSAFAGHGALLRMAKAVGSKADVAEASYLLAKSQVPLLGRLSSTQYAQEAGTISPDGINVGFREFLTADTFASSPMVVKNQGQEYFGSYSSVICYAHYDMYEVFSSYSKRLWNELRRYDKIYKLYFPNGECKDGSGETAGDSSRLEFKIFDGMPAPEARRQLDMICRKALFYIRDGNYIETLPLILSAGSPITLTSWAPLAAPSLTFSPSQKEAKLKLPKVPEGFVLEALSSKRPQSVRAAEKELDWSYDSETFKLSVKVPAGDGVEISALYSEIDPQLFTPFPTPQRPKCAPDLRDEFKPAKFERAEKPQARK